MLRIARNAPSNRLLHVKNVLTCDTARDDSREPRAVSYKAREREQTTKTRTYKDGECSQDSNEPLSGKNGELCEKSDVMSYA